MLQTPSVTELQKCDTPAVWIVLDEKCIGQNAADTGVLSKGSCYLTEIAGAYIICLMAH